MNAKDKEMDNMINPSSARRREQEMSAFSAMARGVDNSNSGSPISTSDLNGSEKGGASEEDSSRKMEPSNLAAVASGVTEVDEDSNLTSTAKDETTLQEKRELTAPSENSKAREEDAIRRKNEMNVFSAMATGLNSPLSSEEMAKDEIRRKNEMNAFSAMATGLNSPLSSEEKAKDEVRRKNEMNAFSIMATGLNSPLSCEEKAKDKIRKKNEMNSFSAMANGLNSPISSEEIAKDEMRRKSEMNEFSAMANGLNRPLSSEEMAKDEMRRKNEMNAFSAMVNGMNSPMSSEQMAKDEMRRKNEMNAFSAMANGSGALELKEKEEDALRRKNEMNAFSAMATGLNSPLSPEEKKKDEMRRKNDAMAKGLESPLGSNEKGGDERRRKNEMNAFSAMANGSGTLDLKAKEEDAIRRKNEMNAFSAMAMGVLPSPTGNKDGITEFPNTMTTASNSTITNSSSSNEQENQGKEVESSGTFVNSTNDSSDKPMTNNINAALASFSDFQQEKDVPHSTVEMSFQGLKPGVRKKPVHNQMYSECIFLPRPLFFGRAAIERMTGELVQFNTINVEDSESLPNLRTFDVHGNFSNITNDFNKDFELKEEITSMSDSQKFRDKSYNVMSLEIPEEYRNLKGALMAFGNDFGEQVKDDESMDESNLEQKSGPCYDYVKLYEPVWGERSRLEREERIISADLDVVKERDDLSIEIEASGSSIGSNPECVSPEKECLSGSLTSSSSSCTPNEKIDAPSEAYSSNDFGQSGDLQPADPAPMSENLFLRYARGDVDDFSGSIVDPRGSLTSVPEANVFVSDTFRHIDMPSNPSGSFEGGELKKQVGLTESMSQALDSFAESTGGVGAGSLNAVDAGAAATEAAAPLMITEEDGRPLTNLELTGGQVPLYGCDDAPLPSGVDLGTFETIDEKRRSEQQAHAQKRIASCVVPNIFGPIVCPNTCTGPDDSQNWTRPGISPQQQGGGPGAISASVGRSAKHERGASGQSNKSSSTADSVPVALDNQSSLPPPPPPPPLDPLFPRGQGHNHTPIVNQSQNHVQHNEDIRTGWWNVPDNFGFKPPPTIQESEDHLSNTKLQLPPLYNESDVDVITNLYPNVKTIREQNRCLSELSPATPTAKCLPFLSDRSPNTRYLQIDTPVVGFPPVGEIEPLFCSLAIWHIEVSSAPGNSAGRMDGTGIAPNLHRCGRITASLNFDVVSDSDVKQTCKTALWPTLNSRDVPESDDVFLEGTRCGVFPIPANFNLSNLYAVLIVHKTLAEDSEIDIYMKPATQQHDDKVQQEKINPAELSKLRSKAGKSSERLGQFLTPFAFGVAPLVDVVGSDAPSIPTSHAVQMPLFKMRGGRGERPIIDHILAASHRRVGLKHAELTKEGKAMLVMRNFGYLGLHSAIHSNTKLARDRLVDFTGDVQVRRTRPEDSCKPPEDDGGRIQVASGWHKDFVSEPTKKGGRNLVPMSGDEDIEKNGIGKSMYISSSLYAQEVAPLPLAITPTAGRSPRIQGDIPTIVPKHSSGMAAGSSGNDAEPFFHTSVCNELICLPRILHNCSKRNITVKVEVRRLKYSEDLDSYIATLPRTGPSLHNNRRGPFLVNELFTACSYHTIDPHFLDEFKIKLPFALKSSEADNAGRLVALFSVYNVHVREKRRWFSRRFNETTAQAEIDSEENTDRKSSAPNIDLLGCGFLPLCSADDVPCLIQNGLHDVKLEFMSKAVMGTENPHMLSEEVDICSHSSGDALILEPLSSAVDNETMLQKSNPSPVFSQEFDAKFWQSDNLSGNIAEGADTTTTRVTGIAEEEKKQHDYDKNHPMGMHSSTPSVSSLSTTAESTSSKLSKSRETGPIIGSGNSSTRGELMVLQVRTIALSSVHPQNTAISKFFNDSVAAVPRPLTQKEIDTEWAIPRELLGHYQKDLKFTALDKSLLRYTREIASTSTCPHYDLVPHFVRLQFQLWRSLVWGTSEPSLHWANPECLIPLRLHSFSSLLHVISSVNSFMMKSGVKQLDGKRKWNITTMSRIVCLLFDEELLFRYPNGKVLEDAEHLFMTTKNETNAHSQKNCDHEVKTISTETIKADECDQLYIQTNGQGQENNAPEPVKVEFKDSPRVSSKDDLNLLSALEKPSPLRSRCNSAPSPKPFKIDSKTDFQSALSAGEKKLSPGGSASSSGTGIGPAANRRKWLTAPSLALATIQEDNDKLVENRRSSVNTETSSPSSSSKGSVDALDTELVLHKSKPAKVKQMRVPNVQTKIEETEDISLTPKQLVEDKKQNDSDCEPKIVPKTDEEIENAGTAFLDMIGNLGPESVTSEENRVGFSHHRKTRSRCSIDWTLPPTDLLIENHQQMEHLHLHDVSPSPSSNFSVGDADSDEGSETTASSSVASLGKERSGYRDNSNDGMKDFTENSISINMKEHPIKKRKKQKDSETGSKMRKITLPSFIDRVTSLQKRNERGRWFPYTYEVIIFQWVIMLSEQARKSDQTRNSKNRSGTIGREVKGSKSKLTRASEVEKSLNDAASKARGVSIGCAPVLFEIIKKSLGFRIDSLFRKQRNGKGVNNNSRIEAPLLVCLDETMAKTLEDLIAMVTDACIDSRNFDSLSFRQAAIFVNDAIVRFLRDLFALLDTQFVQHLIIVYFSRFGMKDGKHWRGGDSKIGLRCSWEVSKLRLNAITKLVRFADFVKVNKPIMESWSEWSSNTSSQSSKRLTQLEKLGMADFTASEGPTNRKDTHLPGWQPHWLVELVTDICLSATGHVEPSIQERAGALLYETFWRSSREGRVNGTLTIISSMYIPFISKILGHNTFLSSLSPKSQLSKNLLTCAVFIMQSAPSDLLRALWKKLCFRSAHKAHRGAYGAVDTQHLEKGNEIISNMSTEHTHEENECILDVFSLLNLALKTFEYEGSETNLEEELGDAIHERTLIWEKEFLLAIEEEDKYLNTPRGEQTSAKRQSYSTSSSRKWHAHDGAIVIINASRNIVREFLVMIQKNSVTTPNTSIGHNSHDRRRKFKKDDSSEGTPFYSVEDKVIFARAAVSLYLHCLSLRQSDIVYAKALIAAVEIVKAFGIEIFLAAVGDTLQHWMRVILVHCGARRDKVRIEASDLLALILRLTWLSYGSFSRVRLPLIAVQTEVMERIVATAAARSYREQRRMKAPVQSLSNESAEAALTPFWRTIHRLHHLIASKNDAFKSALQRLAEGMKTLYRAYIAAHALAIVNRNKAQSPMNSFDGRSMTLSTRVLSASAGFSTKILGSERSDFHTNAVIHNEAVEEAFLEASYVFSQTELPLLRVAWLRKLAEFHASRQRYAEEGTCRFEIYETLRQAAILHDNLWNCVPFWPWANDSSSDGVHLNGEGPVGSSLENLDDEYDLEEYSAENDASVSGKQIEKNNSFRRIFYRVANSVRMRTGDWDVGGNKHLFYGVTFASEYSNTAPWISLREIEEDMVEEAEAAGELFLKAGIVEKSRHSWSLAAKFYSSVYNYAKLAHVYQKLASVVECQIPVVDTSTHLELSSPLGRFYRVHFHGGPAEELDGQMFVYRASYAMKLDEFCSTLRNVMSSILPEKTPIDLELDDGRLKEAKNRPNQKRPLGSEREKIKIRVTPLRALLDKDNCARGTCEWFHKQVQMLDFSTQLPSKNLSGSIGDNGSNQKFETFSRKTLHTNKPTGSSDSSHFLHGGDYKENSSTNAKKDPNTVNKFSFTQPKDRKRGSRDLLKSPSGDIAEKSLRVTELIVRHGFPTCVTRQSVLHHFVSYQSPLEAAVESVCSWCAVLFRTAVATNGLAVIGRQGDQGLNKSATKVVADCIHSRRIEEIAQTMLKGEKVAEERNANESEPPYDRLPDNEKADIQIQLARAIILVLELLHVLVGRNRDLLLTVVQDQKRRDASSTGSHYDVTQSPGQTLPSHFDGTGFDGYQGSRYDESGSVGFVESFASHTAICSDAMAIQRELQLSFISMTKALLPYIQGTVFSETPRWMRSCQDKSYFSSGAYRQTRIAIAEELLYFCSASQVVHNQNNGNDFMKSETMTVPLTILPKRSNSPHGSYAESIPSRASRNTDLEGRKHQNSPSLTTYTF